MTAGVAAALLTADTPRWLFFLMLGFVVSSYALCGFLVLGSRHRRARRARRERVATPITTRDLPPARGLAITVPAPKETTR